mgnify:CR=1 FL=1
MNDWEKIDSNILVSLINTKLRNNYSSLDELCEDLNINRNQLENTLKKIDYYYNTTRNQFI